MQQLHLVGFTADNRGLIFSARKGAKSGGFVVNLDDKLLARVDEMVARREAEAQQSSDRPKSALSPREIQARLRAGRSIQQVAREAGVEEEWVARWAAPIAAEQAQVVERAQALTMEKGRVGPSAVSLGESVRWNMADRGIVFTDAGWTGSWDAYHLRSNSWMVRFTYVYRRATHQAEWEVDTRDAVVVSRNRQATELGYVAPGTRRPKMPRSMLASVNLPSVAPPVPSSSSARPKASGDVAAAKPAPARPAPAKKKSSSDSKKVAARTAAAKKKWAAIKKAADRKAAADRLAARKAAAKRAAEAKKEAEKKAAAKKAAAKKAATARASKKATAKKATAKKAGKKAAPKKSVARKSAPRKSTARKSAAKKTAPRKSVAKKTAPRKSIPKKASARKSPAKKAVVTRPRRPPAAPPIAVPTRRARPSLQPRASGRPGAAPPARPTNRPSTRPGQSSADRPARRTAPRSDRPESRRPRATEPDDTPRRDEVAVERDRTSELPATPSRTPIRIDSGVPRRGEASGPPIIRADRADQSRDEPASVGTRSAENGAPRQGRFRFRRGRSRS